MAILRGPYGTTQIKGSIGATTFQQSQFGLVARSRTKPVNPNTPRQNLVRTAMNVAAQLWKVAAADPVVYAAWQNYAQNTTWHNSLGDPVKLGARQHFIRINSFIIAGSGTVQPTPPAAPGLPSPSIVEYSVDTTDGFQLLDVLPAEASEDLVIFQLSGPQSQSRYFWKGPFQYTFYLNSASVFPIVALPDTSIAIGQRYFFQTRAFITSQGLSVPLSGFIDAIA